MFLCCIIITVAVTYYVVVQAMNEYAVEYIEISRVMIVISTVQYISFNKEQSIYFDSYLIRINTN